LIDGRIATTACAVHAPVLGGCGGRDVVTTTRDADAAET
jgi:hypothetical protein